MNVFTLDAILRLDSSQYEGGLKQAQSGAQSMGSKIGSALGTAAKVGAAALAAATTAVVAFGKSSVDAGMNFDSSMSQVAATMGYTVDQLNDSTSEASQNFNRLRDFAQEMGRTTAFSATQAADALNYMALAGYDADTSMQMLPTVLDLAAAGNMDLAQASDMVTDAQSALGLTIEETTTMVDQMAKASSKSNTSVSQLGEAFLTIGATARNMKGGTAELATVLGVLADNGIKGAEGGTHLRNMILSLQNPTKDSAAIMDKLKLSVYDSSGNMRSMVDIVAELRDKTAGMDQASRDAIVSGIFNKTDLAAVNALLGTTDERFEELTQSITNADGAAKAMAETQLDNLAGDITLFQSALEGAKIAISDGLTPTLREFVQFGTESISNITTAFKEDGIDGAMEALSGAIEQGMDMIFDTLPTVMDAGMQLLEAIINGIINNLPKLIDATFQIIEKLASGIQNNLPRILQQGLEIIRSLAQGLLNNMPTIIQAITNVVLNMLNFFKENAREFVGTGLEIIIKFVSGLLQALPEVLNAIVQIVGQIIAGFIDKAPELLQLGVQYILTFIEGMIAQISGVASAAKEIVNALIDTIGSIAGQAWTWGSDMMLNFINGIRSWFDQLVTDLKSIGQTVVNFLGFSEPKMGPLSNFHTFAPDMMELFASGIRDNADLIEDAFNDSVDLGMPTVNTTSGHLGTSGSTSAGGGKYPDKIVMQVVLDKRVIGETSYSFSKQMARVIG